jgi:hypothetical protein
LGDAGQAVLRNLHVAVIGLGGTGSVAFAKLAHLGVGRITVVDGDRVESSNVSRILGATANDIGVTWKVDVAARYAAAVGRVALAGLFGRSGNLLLQVGEEEEPLMRQLPERIFDTAPHLFPYNSDGLFERGENVLLLRRGIRQIGARIWSAAYEASAGAAVFATPAAEPPAFRTAGRLEAIVRNSAQSKAIASIDIISTLDYRPPHGVRTGRN